MLVLVTGGAASGKSEHAEKIGVCASTQQTVSCDDAAVW